MTLHGSMMSLWEITSKIAVVLQKMFSLLNREGWIFWMKCPCSLLLTEVAAHNLNALICFSLVLIDLHGILLHQRQVALLQSPGLTTALLAESSCTGLWITFTEQIMQVSLNRSFSDFFILCAADWWDPEPSLDWVIWHWKPTEEAKTSWLCWEAR